MHDSMLRIIIREIMHLWVYQTKKDYIISALSLGGPTNNREMNYVRCLNAQTSVMEPTRRQQKNEHDSVVRIIIMRIVYLWVY